jgi:hypothetical protein
LDGFLKAVLDKVIHAESSFAESLFTETHHCATIDASFPSMHQLRRAVKRLTALLQGKAKISLLLDGLDEHFDDHFSMTVLGDLLTTFGDSSNVKMLISSRQNRDLECVSGKAPDLLLEDWMYPDVTQHVEDMLPNNSRLRSLVHVTPSLLTYPSSRNAVYDRILLFPY